MRLQRSYLVYLLLLLLLLPYSSTSECGTFISPCQLYMNKVYQFVGNPDEPAKKLVTNLNFYASEACIGNACSFITVASLEHQETQNCPQGFKGYVTTYESLSFVVHSLEYLELYNITCNRDVEKERIYNVLDGEIECFQDGKSFFASYMSHIPSRQDNCFSIGSVDFFAKENGTRNIRLSDNGCRDNENDEEL